MSKSVLVMETPENCKSCIHIGTFIHFCRVNCRDIEDPSVKPDWCPLKPLPEKMKLTGVYNREHFQSNGKMPSYKIGWNDCIDEITGGEVDGEIDT